MNNLENQESKKYTSEQKNFENGQSQDEFNNLFRQMSDTAPVLIWIADLTKGCFWFNKRWLDFTGRTLEQEKGNGWAEGVHPDDLARCLEIYTTSFDARQKFSMEYQLRRYDGEYCWFLDNGVPRFTADGEFLGFIGSCIDITEQKRTEGELIKLNRQIEQQALIFNATLSTITDYVYRLDRNGRFIYANQVLLDFWGIKELDPSGISMRELDYPKEVEEKVLEGVRQVFETKQTVKDQTSYTSPTGASEYHEFIFNPVFADDGSVDFIIGSSRDISEHKKLEAELKEADRRKDEFLATLAHELRNPLAPIRSGLEVIRRFENNIPPPVKSTLDIIERQNNQIMHLVDDLLDISRITQGKITLKKERIQLKQAIELAIETCSDVIESNKHQFTLTLPGNPIYIDADLTRISQIILNVLSNAAKYTPPGGDISLTSRKEGEKVLVIVRDSGIGIPAKVLSKVFDLFSQLESVAEQARSGLGIGLSVAKELTEMHGGTISVSSEGQGKGSEFVIEFPLAVEQSPIINNSAKSASQPTVNKSAERKRILVVDDNADAAEMLKVLLEFEGYDVQIVFDAESAIEKITEFQPAACLSDIGLPAMNGYDLAKQLRRMMPEILLISVSGWGQDKDRRLSQEAGFNYHLVKPVEFEKLTSLVKQIENPNQINN